MFLCFSYKYIFQLFPRSDQNAYHGHTVVYFESVQQQLSCWKKNPPQHHLWINPLLKLVPDNYIIWSCFSNVY